jgi:hypothetical protein
MDSGVINAKYEPEVPKMTNIDLILSDSYFAVINI